MIPIASLTRTYENRCPPPSDAATLRLRGAALEVNEGTLTIKPVLLSENSSFGAEVSGVDWSRPITEDIVKQVSTVVT